MSQNIDTGSQINNLLRELKNQINILDDVQKRKSTFSNQNYIQKIENIYKDKNIELQKLKEIHKSQSDKIKQDNDKNLKILEK